MGFCLMLGKKWTAKFDVRDFVEGTLTPLYAGGLPLCLPIAWNVFLALFSFSELVQRNFHAGIEIEPPVPTLTQHPNVWSDGSRVTHEVAKFRGGCCGQMLVILLCSCSVALCSAC